MGTCADADVQPSDPMPPSVDHAAGFSSSEEASLVDKFQNVVGLHPHSGGGGGGGSGDSDGTNTVVLPLRPYAGDCPHYIKTGVCKFGAYCKFNHPVKRTGLVVGDKISYSVTDGQHVECKYYLTAEGCKYGDSCRYRHAKAGSDGATPLLNLLGLPMRSGEKECPYFMRNGSCGYGAQCVFHHPEPSSIEKPNDKSLRQSGHFSRSRDCDPVPLHLVEDSKPHQEHWSLRPLSGSTISHQNDEQTIPNSFLQHSGLNQYQVPEYPHQRYSHLTPGAEKAYMLHPIIPPKVEDYPQRPSQPECAYFMKTGFCKFKSACRFHHPKGPQETLLSEKGLPLRPGRSICRHYERFGFCKFGPGCLFDHSVNHISL